MDIEEIRRKKLEELKKQKESQSQGVEQKDRILAIARQVCEEKAYDRLTNLFEVKPERFQKALEYCIAYYRRTGKKIDDSSLRNFLETLARMSERKTRIEFRRK